MKPLRCCAMLTAFVLLAPLALAGELPDPALTPGALNPEVTQANIDETICVRGYSKSIRPPVSYTNKLKRLQIREYGYRETDPHAYEEDHLVALGLGGHPTDPRNLFPQPLPAAHFKDRLEDRLHQLVCQHRVPLAEAQQAMARNWVEAYRKYVGE